ncbi:SGNH/GDSL hydrolase family protein [Alteromonas sp. BL110]|uniref:PKD domain-containing protein n=1 Tax=Alteromonas sp. BL110 TaxID=1714845 RepID=UPI000E491503|nr:GDSL-type esterase/lipase family protein [Alteromonas sp. BL110]AXT40270.1 SGNH/GDSL hydrolase family protein [Alteromonas sp. BL110]RKM79502.1 SGNH/GDSL hydrolase family protein [Alteromonas sp. BL110]
MAFYLQMLEAEATIPNWQASGDFTITAGLKFKAVEELFIGLQSSGNSYIATFPSGELLFKASSAIFTGYNPPIDQYIELTITRVGSAISISVDGSEIASGTDSGTMNIDAIGFNSNSGYSGASIDLYYLTLSTAGDDRSYVVTDSALEDENEVSGSNNATFITPMATYNFVEYSQGSGTVTANAGPNLNAEPNDPVILDGSASTSTGDPITSYTWTQISPASPTVIIGNANNAIANFDAPDITENFVFQLEVSNGDTTDTDTVTVVVQQGVVAGTYNIVWDGDSRTFGTGSDPVLPVPDRVNDLLTPTPTFSNFGVGGQQTSDAQSTFNANVIPAYDESREFNIYVLNGFGINDCRLGRSSSDIIASLTDLAERAKALGFYVVISTIPPRDTSTETIEATRVAVNDWIMSNTETSIDLRYDLNSDERIGVWSSYYYSDISHLNYAGQDIWAENISIAIADEFEGLSTSAVPVNQTPTANAGPDQSVAAATQFMLDGTGSLDTDGTIVEWRWTQTAGDTVILNLEDPARPTATSPSRTIAQTLTFQLITVDDEGEESSPGTVNVNVAAVVLSEILKVIERLDFDLATQGDVNAYFGRANREVMKLKPSDPTGLALDADGFMLLDSNTIEEVRVIAGGSSISSKTDSINLDGSEMLVRLGDLEASKNGSLYFSIVVFVEGDTKGVVVSSKGSSGNKPMSYVTL